MTEPTQTPGPIARKCADLSALIARARAAHADAQQVRAKVIAALPAAQARHDAYAVARFRRDLQNLDRAVAHARADARRLVGEVDRWIDGFPEPHRTAIRDRIVFAHVSAPTPPALEGEPEGGA
ncbi:MAG TPA: hypothetical protein VMV29_06680 [Ktedonobacterales bacterium]|nr:hypothetical protein [Ktedonobacterales bacterium]